MEVTRNHAQMCAALSDYHRLLLLYALAESPQNVSQLVQRVGLSQPTVSRHLKIMRQSGVVSAVRDGKSVRYFPADIRIVKAMDMLRVVLMEQLQRKASGVFQAPERPRV